MENIQNNINNLVHLWATVSSPFNGYASDDIISCSQINNSEWPNKVWSKQVLTPHVLGIIKGLLFESKGGVKFVDFEYNELNNNKLIEDCGFELSSSMPGMHLRLEEGFQVKGRLHMSLVANVNDARTWCDIFRKSFGYVISEEVVVKSMHKINYYIAYENLTPVGVVKLNRMKDVVGIYSLGVPPNHRGNGFAKEIMQIVLNNAFNHGVKLATLQASKLAQGMYERLGFKKDFTMNSYKLKNQ